MPRPKKPDPDSTAPTTVFRVTFKGHMRDVRFLKRQHPDLVVECKSNSGEWKVVSL